LRIDVRPATPKDADAIFALIQGLADFEKLEGPDEAAKERMRTGLFDGRLGMITLFAEVGGQPAGYAVAYEQYSTFEGLPKLFLEDIFVLEEHRGTGAGYALFREVAAEAARRGCCEMEWQVLTWNRGAMDFYNRLGARRDEAWYIYLLDAAGIRNIAEQPSQPS
jgi:GNAT superfamily N-acetyltransferase